ncbi:MAG: hypothetical protein NWE93_05460 [Candidatus Bathyarchaeota archaeon]|nr:hypothetical protein [Candidatus Bathyarchaeota archaeon]
MVKVYDESGKKQEFDRNEVQESLKAAGLPPRVAEEVAERVEGRVEDGWSAKKIHEETDVELRRLQDDIDKAHASYKGAESMGAYNVGETRFARESDSTPGAQPRSETKVECRNVENAES